MYLKELLTTGHKIFGAARVPAVASSLPWPSAPSIVSVALDFGHNIDDNVYTYIIGDNGVGKSSYFKTIISHFYLNDGTDDLQNSAAAEYMLSMGVSVHKNVDLQKDGLKAVYGDVRIVNFSREEGILSKYPREGYFEFNPQTSLLSLSLLPLLNSRHDKLDLLEKAMGLNCASWRHELILKTTLNLTKLKFYLSKVGGFAITDIQDWVRGDFDHSLERKYQKLARKIKTLTEKNHHPYNLNDLKTQIENTIIFKNIATFVAKYFSEDGSRDNLNNISVIELYNANNIELPPIEELSNDDILYISFLVDTGLVTYNVFCNDVRVDDMSSGEKSMLHLYSAFASIPNLERGDLLVFYDEPENSLHPQWQQQFPLVFNTIVNDVYGINKSHFIFATHSPLIIQNCKKTNEDHVYVLKFQRKDRQFHSVVIDDIDAYCIESLMMDQFDVTYRSKRKQKDVEDYIRQRQNEDPIDSIRESHELKETIDNLYSELCKDE